MNRIAGVDVGGTKTLAVTLDPAGNVLTRAQVATDGDVVATVTALLAEVGDGFDAIGVGIPGVVSSGVVRHAVNLGVGADGVELAKRLTASTGAAVTVENDVNAAAVGAAAWLDDPGTVVYLGIGTGVAAGIVIDGRLHRGAHGAAGEVGHLVVAPDGPACPCGQRGCLEVVASGSALARRWPGGAATLFAGDDPFRTDVARYFAQAVSMLGQTLDPHVLVLGGGVAEAGEPLLDAVRAELRFAAGRVPLLGELDLASRVVLAPSDAALGAVGAALLAGHA